MTEQQVVDSITTDQPLRVAALIKQIPVAESLVLGPDGRLVRDASPLEMNAYCRRAVSKGVEIARTSGGRCVVFTLGPPPAEDALREAVAWGADEGVHLCDPAFAGSDTLATARALAAALRSEGPFDLILVGRNTIDGDTGQVGPELAQLLDLPFAAGVRHLALDGRSIRAQLEEDDGWATVELELPAVLSCAERLCEPSKVPPEGRAAVDQDRLRRLSAGELGPGPWGDAGSPTKVGAVRTFSHDRRPVVLTGSPAEQVHEALDVLESLGALATPRGSDGEGEPPVAAPEASAPTGAEGPLQGTRPTGVGGGAWCVLVERGRLGVARELLSAARRLFGEAGGRVVAFGEAIEDELGMVGADEVVEVGGALAAEDVAGALTEWCGEERVSVILAPSTSFGREVAGRVAASLDAGLIGDAMGVELVDGVLVAPKPAFSGVMVADITCTSRVQLVSVRPGVLPVLPVRGDRPAVRTRRTVEPARRVRTLAEGRDDDLEVLARADVVIGVGSGVSPEEYHLLDPLAKVLGAEVAATRKVTDRGWMPRSRQIGITGRSVAPRLYVAVGLSGKFNHVVGVRSAGAILAVNPDAEAPIFGYADVGIVGDWHQVVPLLSAHLEERRLLTARP
jgi:electron transfer flavoprotein alpha subunit